MPKLDPILHQELRLAIMSFLANVESADFKKLLEITEATKGNLSVQLSKLEGVSYIQITKTFKGKYPHTSCSISSKGRKAFKTYIKDLKRMLDL
ncbi:MAG: transcriptional regulator [Bacteroidia bacterium]